MGRAVALAAVALAGPVVMTYQRATRHGCPGCGREASAAIRVNGWLGYTALALGFPYPLLKHAVLHQQRDDQVCRALGGGEDTGQRIACYPAAGPQVDHLPPVQICGELGTWFVEFLGEYGGELLPYVLEALRDSPLHTDPAQHLRSLFVCGSRAYRSN